MGLRAELERTRWLDPGATPGRAFRVLAPLLALLVLLLSAAPAEAQRRATGRAVVQIPTVSQLDVQPVTTTLASSSDVRTGLLRVRVRANHEWKVVVAVPTGLDKAVWVRAVGGAATDYRRLEPGTETVIASGDRGETEIRIEYRWDDRGSAEGAALPLTYTLASL